MGSQARAVGQAKSRRGDSQYVYLKVALTAEIARLERINDVIADISQLAIEESSKREPTLDKLASGFDTLLDEYKAEYAALALDEVVVGAIAQVVSCRLCALTSDTPSFRPMGPVQSDRPAKYLA
jgi:hypothetical protein